MNYLCHSLFHHANSQMLSEGCHFPPEAIVAYLILANDIYPKHRISGLFWGMISCCLKIIVFLMQISGKNLVYVKEITYLCNEQLKYLGGKGACPQKQQQA